MFHEYKNRCYSLISNEVYLFSQTVLYINPHQIILFTNFCKVSAELYRPSGLLFQLFDNKGLLATCRPDR